MLLYILAAVGALTVVVVLLIVVVMFFGWLGQPVSYLTRSDEIERYLRSWGNAVADGGRIQVRQRGTDRSVVFVKRQFKRGGDRLVFRFRNADAGRRYFEQVESALSNAGISFEMERTPAGRPRAIVIPFPVGDDPLPLAAGAHAARVALAAMGASEEGPFEMTCTGSHRSDYVRGSVDAIPWTRGYRAGFSVGQVVNRLFGRW
jgi:hypothetical protein